MGLDAAKGAIAIHAGHPGLTAMLMVTDETGDISPVDIEDGAGRMVRQGAKGRWRASGT